MSSPCNSLNVQTIKVSSLSGINGRSNNVIKANDMFLLIQNGADNPSSTNLFSRKSTFKDLLTFIESVPSASYSGSFTGSAIGNFTGSFTGSFDGYISASAAFSNKAAFYGTSSWAQNANHALTADSVPGVPTGTGTTNQFAYWTDPNNIAATSYIVVDPNTNNSVPPSQSQFGQGRLVLNRPIQIDRENHRGQHLIQYSASVAGSHEMYDIGLQRGNNYIRTGKSFAIFYSGSYDQSANDTGKDTFWRPDKPANIGKSGWTSFVVRQRIVGIGHFPKSADVNAQCHIHLTGSFGWPSSGGYNPNRNVLLATSGSSYTPLMRLSGSGQFDVAGDIVSFSTFASSDNALKMDVQPIEDATSKLESLNPVSFVWKSNNQPDFGLIAQEVEESYPELVRENMIGYKAVKYTSFIPLLIKCVQDQQKQIDALTKKIAELEV